MKLQVPARKWQDQNLTWDYMTPKLRATLHPTAMKWRSSVRNRVLAGGNTVLPVEPETER